MCPQPRKVALTPDREFRVGELRRHVLLGSEAVYRVCGWNETLVEVEVVSAPGLKPGRRFHLAASAVAKMAVVSEPGDSQATSPNAS